MKMPATIALVLVLAIPAAASPVALGREDIARAWLRMEKELREKPPKPADRTRIGQKFDVKTRAFFRGGFGEVVRGIDEITAELRGTSAVAGPTAFALAFRLRIEPLVWVIGETKEAQLTGGPLYDVDITDEDLGKLRLRLLDPEGATQVELPIRKRKYEAKLSLSPTGLVPGLYEYRIVGPDGIDEPAGRLPVHVEVPETTQARNGKRIDALPEKSPAQAVAAVRARNALLVTKPGPNQSYAWLRSPYDLAKEVDAEITALEKGKNPYAGRTGDLWRVVDVDGESAPFRIFVPENTGGKPARLVFALHGAGADENAFFEGYGFGLIRELAAKRGFIVVAPLTLSVTRKARAFTTILDTVCANHSVDTSRVYVLGHSLGAFATGFLARAHSDRITATCQIAGGTGRTGDSGPPVLFVHAGRDRILQLRAPEESDLVTVRRFPDEAHTFVVAKALPGILDWLFEFPKSE